MTSAETDALARTSGRSPSPDRAAGAAFGPDLARLRALAGAVPGPLPTAFNGIKFAASVRPRKFVVEGGDETPVAMPRTAFQVVYDERTIMLDTGMDRETHESFGADEPFFPEAAAKLAKALERASLIVLTHYHADHVAGVLRAPDFGPLARKTLVTSRTLDLLVNAPHRPHLKVSEADAARFVVFDYADCFPVAPGVVLIKAPGHSPDSQMVFVRLRSGQEILHSVDSAWNLDNVRELRGKAAPWVKEDAPAVMAQLRWLKALRESEPAMAIVITHDGEVFDDLVSRGIVGAELAGC